MATGLVSSGGVRGAAARLLRRPALSVPEFITGYRQVRRFSSSGRCDGQQSPDAAEQPPDDSTAEGASTNSSEQAQKDDIGGGVGSEHDAAERMVSVEEHNQVLEEVGMWKERWVRAMADMENGRRIAQRDVVNAREYGVSGLAKSLLDVSDNLRRALALVPASDTDAGGRGVSTPAMPAGGFDGFVAGIRATESELMKVLGKAGVVEFGAIGDAFDPNRHQAMFKMAASHAGENGVVLAVTKPGFMIKERVLRPAEVGVGAVST